MRIIKCPYFFDKDSIILWIIGDIIAFYQEFLRTCLEVHIVQGFTMTEATCSGTLQPVGCKQVRIKISRFFISFLFLFCQVGVCGGPMWGCEVRIVEPSLLTWKDWHRGSVRSFHGQVGLPGRISGIRCKNSKM